MWKSKKEQRESAQKKKKNSDLCFMSRSQNRNIFFPFFNLELIRKVK